MGNARERLARPPVTRRCFIAATLALLCGYGTLAGCASGGARDPLGDDTGADAARAMLQSTFFAFNTVCVIGGVMRRPTLDAAVSRCLAFERLFSRTIETSDVSRVNSANGSTTTVDPATAELVSSSLDYRVESGGAFDITIGAVSELWDFVAGVMPSASAIEAALPHVGAEVLVDLSSSTITLPDPEARLDLGGIAKGFVADAVIDGLVQEGVESAFVNLGGNVAVLGSKADGSPWSIGVRDPLADADAEEGGSSGDGSPQGSVDPTSDPSEVIATIEATGGSVVTSGLYERSFEQEGRRWWHILDPRTGYPVETDLISASVYSPRSIDGEGFTKPLFFLGAQGAIDFLSQRPPFQGLVITTDGALVTTRDSGFRAR